MYCVRCGVKLQEGVKACPLCGTPLWCPEAGEGAPASAYSDRYPEVSRQKRLTVMASLTVILLSAMIACFSIAMNIAGRMGWSFYVIAGAAAFYCIFLLPFWFQKPHPMIFVPVAFLVACLLLLSICLYTGGREGRRHLHHRRPPRGHGRQLPAGGVLPASDLPHAPVHLVSLRGGRLRPLRRLPDPGRHHPAPPGASQTGIFRMKIR